MLGRTQRLEARMGGDERVGGAPHAFEREVVVNDHDRARAEPRLEALEAQRDRVVPFAVDVGECDRRGGAQRVGELAPVERDVAQPEVGERLGDPTEEDRGGSRSTGPRRALFRGLPRSGVARMGVECRRSAPGAGTIPNTS